MTDNRVVGVILAAGKGSRIQPLSMSYPKPLLPFATSRSFSTSLRT